MIGNDKTFEQLVADVEDAATYADDSIDGVCVNIELLDEREHERVAMLVEISIEYDDIENRKGVEETVNVLELIAKKFNERFTHAN